MNNRGYTMTSYYKYIEDSLVKYPVYKKAVGHKVIALNGYLGWFNVVIADNGNITFKSKLYKTYKGAIKCYNKMLKEGF